MTHSSQKESAKEKPSMAPAVSSTLTAVTAHVPSLRVRKSEASEETTVPAAMIMEMTPIAERGAPSSTRMDAHPEPRRESGRPRLMKAM